MIDGTIIQYLNRTRSTLQQRYKIYRMSYIYHTNKVPNGTKYNIIIVNR